MLHLHTIVLLFLAAVGTLPELCTADTYILQPHQYRGFQIPAHTTLSYTVSSSSGPINVIILEASQYPLFQAGNSFKYDHSVARMNVMEATHSGFLTRSNFYYLVFHNTQGSATTVTYSWEATRTDDYARLGEIIGAAIGGVLLLSLLICLFALLVRCARKRRTMYYPPIASTIYPSAPVMVSPPPIVYETTPIFYDSRPYYHPHTHSVNVTHHTSAGDTGFAPSNYEHPRQHNNSRGYQAGVSSGFAPGNY